METILIQLTNQKAYKLLQDMEELDLIRVLRQENFPVSSLRGKIQLKMDEEEINKQLDAMRKEWQRDF